MPRRRPIALYRPWTFLGILMLSLGSLSAPHLATGATYHVTTNGGGSTCSSGSPCGNIETGVSKLTSPGDILDIHGGEYHQNLEANNFIGQLAGTEGNPVIIRSAPGEQATIYGWINIADSSHQYIILDHLIVDGTGILGATVSFGPAGAHHLTFQNGEVRNGEQGLTLDVPDFRENVTMQGHHNTFRNCINHHNKYSYSFYFGTGHHNTVDNCELYNDGGYGLQIYTGGGMNPNNGSHVVSNNRFYNNGFVRGYGIMTIGGCQNVLVYNNVMYNNDTGLEIRGDADQVQLYNNTIYGGADGYGVVINGTNATIKNNIVYGNAQPGIQNNTSDADIQNNTTTDPSFANAGNGDFQLNPGSSAANNGENLSAFFTTDKNGDPRPASGSWSRGAYQFGSGGPTGLPAPTNLRLISQTP